MTRKDFLAITVQDLLEIANNYPNEVAIVDEIDSDLVSYCEDVETAMMIFRNQIEMKKPVEGYLV